MEVAMTLFTTTSTMRYLIFIGYMVARIVWRRDLHFPAVKFSRESFKVVSGTEAGVQLSRVLDPVT